MRILIVEDEEGILNFLRQGLSEEGYAVDTCNNGKDGLEMAISGNHDLILLDWMLPGMSGIDICQRIRKIDGETPIIFLTAKDTPDEAVFGLQSGADDYIRKPFYFEELLERIRVQLRKSADQGNSLELGDIQMNLDRHEVLKSGEIIQLTKKEFALLEYLIRNKGKVCTRSRIIESVWDIHFDYDHSVIDVHINALRKKLQISSEEYIHSVRGVGYMAEEK